MQHIGRSWLALGCAVLVACGVETSGDDPLGGGPRITSPNTVDAGDAGPRNALGDGGRSTSSDASDAPPGPPPRPTGPGAPPTRAATINADDQGFFELHTQASNLAYWARLPIDYTASTPYPLVIGLHGCGDSAKNFATWAVAPYDQRATQAHIGVSVGGRDGACWDLGQDEAKVLEVIADVRQMFFVHQKKVTLAGYSSGGMLAYYTGLRNAYTFAGILIENSGLPFGDQTDAVLAAAEWKLNIAMSVHLSDANFTIAATRGDRDRLQGAGYPVQFREVEGDHDGNSGDWVDFLLPKIVGFQAP